MPEKSSNESINKEPRTKNVPISLEQQALVVPQQQVQPEKLSLKKVASLKKSVAPKKQMKTAEVVVPKKHSGFELNIEAAKAPNQNFSTATPLKSSQKKRIVWPDSKISSKEFQQNNAPKVSFGTKIWNSLEWLATSALIFMVLFFAINYQAYSIIFIDQLDQWRGKVVTNTYVEEVLQTHPASQTQQPLPIESTPEQNKKQIPALDISIAPPDDRIIVQGINKNVPIVKISSENLIKRDWSALEADIQGALQEGVVHYPGTAEPGQKGNIVITGHSSYFLSDPGKFKDVFALLHKVKIGDKIVVYHEQKAYHYQVYEIKTVTPDKVDVLDPTTEDRLTLITCTPIGTNLKRLIVLAHPVQE